MKSVIGERIIMTRRTISETEANEELNKRAHKVTEEDLERVISKREKIEHLFNSKGPLQKFISEVKLLFSLIKDYYKGDYREIPWWSIAAVVASLIYVLSPVDLIPDFIPIIGYVDDAAVVAACLSLIRKDLDAYSVWKDSF